MTRRGGFEERFRGGVVCTVCVNCVVWDEICGSKNGENIKKRTGIDQMESETEQTTNETKPSY